MKNDIYDLCESLYEFAQIPNYSDVIENLKNLVEDEDWSYHHTHSQSSYPILENYINNTYKRIAMEKKVAYSKDLKYCCFDTGLVSKGQGETVYMMFTENTNPNISCYWHFYKFFKQGQHEVNKFDALPDMAFYWDEPSKLIYDTRKQLVVNVEHIIADNKIRFPAPYNTLDDYKLKMILNGCIELLKNKLKRNYKIAVPQYFFTNNSIQLLIPLCLSSPNNADLAIVVEDYGTMYRASTCLTLDMAINNARLLARPDRDWLNP